MNIEINEKFVKNAAKELNTLLGEHSLQHSKAIEIITHSLGYKDWNTLSSILKNTIKSSPSIDQALINSLNTLFNINSHEQIKFMIMNYNIDRIKNKIPLNIYNSSIAHKDLYDQIKDNKFPSFFPHNDNLSKRRQFYIFVVTETINVYYLDQKDFNSFRSFFLDIQKEIDNPLTHIYDKIEIAPDRYWTCSDVKTFEKMNRSFDSEQVNPPIYMIAYGFLQKIAAMGKNITLSFSKHEIFFEIDNEYKFSININNSYKVLALLEMLITGCATSKDKKTALIDSFYFNYHFLHNNFILIESNIPMSVSKTVIPKNQIINISIF